MAICNRCNGVVGRDCFNPPGMTLRDAMAMSVLRPVCSAKWAEALIGEQHPSDVEPVSMHIDWWMRVEAAYRYRMADAMLKAREGESDSPIKYYKRGGVIYAVHGTSSINFVERLLAEIADLTAKQPPSEGEEIMVNTAHDVYTLPLQPSGLSSGPRFVVHVPGPEQPAAVDGLAARLVDELDGLVSESGGVSGLHLNGDVATWEELLPGGRFERLSSLDELREALAAQAPRACTCHPDDRPDGPCRERYAASECQALAAQAQAANEDALDAARYRWLRKGESDAIAVVRGLYAMNYGMVVVHTYSEEIDGDDLDAAIDDAMQRTTAREGEQ